MDVMTENKVAPSLRFDIFKESWINKLMKECADVIDPHPSHRAPKALIGGIPFIGIGDISENGKLDTSRVRCVSEEIYKEHSNRYTLKNNDFAFGRVASVGKVIDLSANIGKVYTYSPTMAIIQPKEISSIFLRFYCSSEYFISQVNSKTSGSTRKSIGMQALRILNLNLPSLTEQQKIASFLSAVDKKLQQLTKKKELLEVYKKGVMQKIFSKELRFKDDNGNNYPDWEEKMLGEVISEIEDGGTPSTSKEEYFGGNVNWVVIKDIKDVIYQTLNTLTDEGLKKCSSKLWQPETIILSTGATIGRVGIAKVQTATKQGICGIVTNEFILNTFLKYWFVKNIQLLHRFAQGSSFKEIRPKTIKKFTLNLPSIQEQQKMANFLSSLDSKIELVSTQIENTQSFKKGLLQQMFV